MAKLDDIRQYPFQFIGHCFKQLGSALIGNGWNEFFPLYKFQSNPTEERLVSSILEMIDTAQQSGLRLQFSFRDHDFVIKPDSKPALVIQEIGEKLGDEPLSKKLRNELITKTLFSVLAQNGGGELTDPSGAQITIPDLLSPAPAQSGEIEQYTHMKDIIGELSKAVGAEVWISRMD